MESFMKLWLLGYKLRLERIEKRLDEITADLAAVTSAAAERAQVLSAMLETNQALLQMRQAGFVRFDEPASPVSEPLQLPAVVVQAISDRARPGDDLYRTLVEQAHRELRHNVLPEDVAQAIHRGTRVNPW